MDFMTLLAKNEKTTTTNGAISYKTSGSALVDLNNSVPKLRKSAINYLSTGDLRELDVIYSLFKKSSHESVNYTLKWLMYLRDINQGMGERSSYRLILLQIANNIPDLIFSLLNTGKLEKLGRFDDLIFVWDKTTNDDSKKFILAYLKTQLGQDVVYHRNGESVSLLAKWMPSENTSSRKTRKLATRLRKALKISTKDYRKILTALRKNIDVVECKMSNNAWSEIDYPHVTSKANLIYHNAFLKHDGERRTEYLESLSKGDTKINANKMFLYDIVNKYEAHRYGYKEGVDDTLEALWNAQDVPKSYNDILVVRDGSGSMMCSAFGTNVTVLDIADSLTVYTAQHNKSEAFKNKFITFSSRPEIVDLSDCDTLFSKLEKLGEYNDYTTTNVESVFNLILDTAVKNNLKQEELPSTVLVVSDMQFNGAMRADSEDITLFEGIANKFKAHGYSLPKMVFWNVSEYNNTIPLQKNANGLVLMSGFSKNNIDMILQDNLAPLEVLKAELDAKYGFIDSIISK